MRLKVITAILILGIMGLSVSATASSSLSSLGYGLLMEASNPRSAGMGLTSIAVQDSLGLSLHHPALWDGTSTARFGFFGSYIRISSEDNNSSDISDAAGFEGMALAIPILKGWHFGVAVSPFSRMDYEWEREELTPIGSSTIVQEGSGGISQGLIAVSMPVRNDLRLGIALRTLFGKVDQHWRQNFVNSSSIRSGISESVRFHGAGGSISAFWNGIHNWTAGASLNLPVEIGTEQQRAVISGNSAIADTITEETSSHETPLDFVLGIGKSSGRNFGTVELAYHGWDALDKPADISSNFTNAIRISAGWEYKPKYNLLDNYWRALSYRAGLYIQDHYIKGNKGHQARIFGITSGVSIPYFKSKSRLDVALSLGWRGDKQKDGVAEQFYGLTVGFNHSELWFVGRRERRE